MVQGDPDGIETTLGALDRDSQCIWAGLIHLFRILRINRHGSLERTDQFHLYDLVRIEGLDDVLAGVDRNDLYKVYVLEHVVPRFNNPSGVFDNDRYLYEIFVKQGDAALIASLDTLFTQIATVADVNFTQDIDPII